MFDVLKVEDFFFLKKKILFISNFVMFIKNLFLWIYVYYKIF